METVRHILHRIDATAPYRMVAEASVRDYCVLSLNMLRGEATAAPYFGQPLADFLPALEREVAVQAFRDKRYCQALYQCEDDALLADAIADLSFAQAERLPLVTPSSPQADDRERAVVFIVGVYTLLALSLHSRTDFAPLFLHAFANFNALSGARTVRRHYDRSWSSRYSPDAVFYPLTAARQGM